MNIDLNTQLIKKVYDGWRIRVEHNYPMQSYATYTVFIDGEEIGTMKDFGKDELKAFILKRFPNATFEETDVSGKPPL